MTNKLFPGAVTIRGRCCVLIEDIVGSYFPECDDIVPFSDFKGIANFCSRHKLTQLRKQYPQVPVYGIWQIVFASYQDWNEELYAIYFDDNHYEGLFLLHKNSEFNSGRIAQGKALNPFAVSLANAQQIMLKEDEITFPNHPILTAVECEAQMRIRIYRIAVILIAGFMAATLLFFIMQWVTGYFYL